MFWYFYHRTYAAWVHVKPLKYSCSNRRGWLWRVNLEKTTCGRGKNNNAAKQKKDFLGLSGEKKTKNVMLVTHQGTLATPKMQNTLPHVCFPPSHSLFREMPMELEHLSWLKTKHFGTSETSEWVRQLEGEACDISSLSVFGVLTALLSSACTQKCVTCLLHLTDVQIFHVADTVPYFSLWFGGTTLFVRTLWWLFLMLWIVFNGHINIKVWVISQACHLLSVIFNFFQICVINVTIFILTLY